VVKPNFIKQIITDQQGISLVEGILVFPLLLLAFAAFVEFGFMIFQWNQTVKSLQLGARRAAVSDYIVSDITPLADGYSGIGGDPTPAPGTASVSCGTPIGVPCDVDELDRLVFGDDGVCVAGAGNLSGMCDQNPNIKSENIVIRYHRTGLGYQGRPGKYSINPVTTITVEVRNMSFNLPIMGGLFGFNDFAIPANPVSVTSEDLSTCQLPC